MGGGIRNFKNESKFMIFLSSLFFTLQKVVMDMLCGAMPRVDFRRVILSALISQGEW